MTPSTCKRLVVTYRNNLFLKAFRCKQNLTAHASQDFFLACFLCRKLRGAPFLGLHTFLHVKNHAHLTTLPSRDATGVPYKPCTHLGNVCMLGILNYLGELNCGITTYTRIL
jgi:hypothetical protein